MNHQIYRLSTKKNITRNSKNVKCLNFYDNIST